MEVEEARPRKRSSSAKKVYTGSKIPYETSRPNSFWRIKKDLPADQYWKKRYWRRRITGRGDYFSQPNPKRYGTGPNSHRKLALTGRGDYSVKKNVFLSGSLPVMQNRSGSGGTVIRFQEYLKDIVTSPSASTFSIESFLINPGNSSTFPFLSQVANNYEQYEIEGMVFEFRSTSADALNSVNTALGTVMMATQYDVADAPFATKQEMLNYEFSTSVKPSESTLHMVECDPRQTTISELYVLDGAEAPANTDPRLYHLGKFNIATTGFQGTSVNVGELHVTYQVRLLKPKLYTTLGSEIDFFQQEVRGFSSIDILGDAANLLLAVPIGNLDVVVTPTSITFPTSGTQLYYRIELLWFGSVGAAYVMPTITPISCIPMFTYGVPEQAIVAGTVAQIFTVLVYANMVSPSLTFSAANLPTGVGPMRLRIMQINPADVG